MMKRNSPSILLAVALCLALAAPGVAQDDLQERLDAAMAVFNSADQYDSIAMFSDLKRHEMGPKLSESFESPLDPWFITPRLWGIADTAPYLHDGRALTLRDAILMHGGEALQARNNFAALPPHRQEFLSRFLESLRTPANPAAGLSTKHL